MKALVNGGRDVSELDGWRAEAHAPDVGWARGDGEEHGDHASWDAAAATTLYELYAEDVRDGAAMRQEMTRAAPRPASPGGSLHVTRVPATRPTSERTARVMPRVAGVAGVVGVVVPLDAEEIRWQR